MLHTLAEAGATQIEPGHGLTGTTPWHAVEDLAEEPAIAYVTEVSHLWNDRAYVFGGGLYVDPVLPGAAPTTAIIVPSGGGIEDSITLPVELPAPEAIDYYATIPLDGALVQPGDTVIFGFRPQVFVSRGLTAGIADVGSGNPQVTGLWASNGARLLQVGEHDYALASTISTGGLS
jgi:predicted amino acid racemase